MPPTTSPSRARRIVAAGAVALCTGAAAGVAPAAAAQAPPAAVRATPKPAPQPCPGTTAIPAPATGAAAAGTTTPAAPATATYAPPAIPARDVVVGGDRLAANGLVQDLPSGTPAPPALNATSWVIADADSGAVVAAKAPHALLRPASTLKALTALTLLPQLDAKTMITANESDMAADGTKVGIVSGNRYSVASLFSAMLMASANDAVYALTRTAPGGRAKVVEDANALAAHLGALDTVAKDPSGLDVDGQVSSAYDLALIGREALKNKDFRRYSTTKEITFPGARKSDGTVVPPFKVGNHNKLLYNYPGAVGVKNGYTTLSHGTFVAAATRGGKTYLLTYMCADGIGWRDMAASLDWAFAQGAKARPVGELVAAGSIEATPSATPSATESMTAATPTTSSAGESATPSPTPASSADDYQGVVERWWGAAVAALLLLGLGVAGSRRIGRGSHRVGD